MRFRYSKCNKWLKGNTHIHSTKSDGGLDFKQLATLYASKGYDFLYRTDHWVASNVKDDKEKYPLLWLDGIELDSVFEESKSLYHIICLGRFNGLNREMGLKSALTKVKEQGGITILAHPFWCGNNEKDLFRFDFDGVEIYNNVCGWLNGKSDGLVYWNMMLEKSAKYLAFAADDAHLSKAHPTYNGGWIMVQAEECTHSQITSSIKKGLFYSSCGPSFSSIEFSDKTIYAKTSPVRYARLVGCASFGARQKAERGKPLQEFEFKLPENYESWRYFYLELEDVKGKKAWTNTLFIDENHFNLMQERSKKWSFR